MLTAVVAHRPAALALRSSAPPLKWKTPPPRVRVIKNRGAGDWIEKWKSPRTGAWVHNYTQDFMRLRAREKFEQVRAFGKALPAIRARYRADLAGGGRAQVLALIVALIDQAYFRVGNEDSDAEGVHGATTLRRKHVKVEGHTAYFDYRGKKRVRQLAAVVDARLATLLQRLIAGCRRPGDRLFRWEGAPITAREVNQYLAEFGATAKQFRTYHATRLAHELLRRALHAEPAERKRIAVEVVESVAAKLGHTPSVCRSSYIDPTVLAAYEEGRLS